jgi:hypothetical protein
MPASEPGIELPTETPLPTSAPASPTLTVTPTQVVPLTWVQVNDGLEFPRDLIANIFLDPVNRDVIYINTKHSGFYKTVDGGLLWTPIIEASIPDEVRLELLRSAETDKYYNTAPDGIKRIYQFNGNWSVSDDNGNTWRGFSEGGTYRSHTIAFEASGSFYIFCGDNICKFSPDGSKLKILGNPGVGVDSLVMVSRHDPNTIYAGGEGLSVSMDGGVSWNALNNGLGNTVLQLEQNPSILFLMTGECNRGRGRSTMEQPIYRSLDGGLTWKYMDNKGCYLIKDADGKSVYRLATESDKFDPWIWIISGNGEQWSQIPTPTAVSMLAAHPDVPGMLFAYDGFGTSKHFYIKRNSSSNWEISETHDIRPCHGSTMYFVDRYRPMSIDSLNSDHVLYVENNRVLESQDGCTTPQSHTIVVGNTGSVNSVVMDPNDPKVIYAGTDGGAYVSFNGGETWGQINDGLSIPNVVYSIAVDKNDKVYAATPFGIYQLFLK